MDYSLRQCQQRQQARNKQFRTSVKQILLALKSQHSHDVLSPYFYQSVLQQHSIVNSMLCWKDLSRASAYKQTLSILANRSLVLSFSFGKWRLWTLLVTSPGLPALTTSTRRGWWLPVSVPDVETVRWPQVLNKQSADRLWEGHRGWDELGCAERKELQSLDAITLLHPLKNTHWGH